MRQITFPRRHDSLWDFMSEVEKAFDQGLANRQETFTPAIDLYETDEFYLIGVDLPGVDEKNIKIEVENGRLSLSGERVRERGPDEGKFMRFERSYGQFMRTFQLPQNADESKIQARNSNGVLEIMIPKAEVAKPRSVKIETTKGGFVSTPSAKTDDQNPH